MCEWFLSKRNISDTVAETATHKAGYSGFKPSQGKFKLVSSNKKQCIIILCFQRMLEKNEGLISCSKVRMLLFWAVLKMCFQFGGWIGIWEKEPKTVLELKAWRFENKMKKSSSALIRNLRGHLLMVTVFLVQGKTWETHSLVFQTLFLACSKAIFHGFLTWCNSQGIEMEGHGFTHRSSKPMEIYSNELFSVRWRLARNSNVINYLLPPLMM